MKLNKQNAHFIAVQRVCAIISLILMSNDSMWEIQSNHGSNITKKKLPKATGMVASWLVTLSQDQAVQV